MIAANADSWGEYEGNVRGLEPKKRRNLLTGKEAIKLPDKDSNRGRIPREIKAATFQAVRNPVHRLAILPRLTPTLF